MTEKEKLERGAQAIGKLMHLGFNEEEIYHIMLCFLYDELRDRMTDVQKATFFEEARKIREEREREERESGEWEN